MAALEAPIDVLGRKCKAWEDEFNARIDKKKPYIVRIDGRAFHTLTKALETTKPEDKGFGRCMQTTAEYLLREFSPSAVYVQSNEISLLFPASMEMLFGGRVQKICTAIASTASVFFSLTLQSGAYLDPRDVLSRITPTFDARIFQCADDEVADAFLWRILDCRRNAVLGVARYTLEDWGYGKSEAKLRELLDMNAHVSPDFQHGVLFKKKKKTLTVAAELRGGGSTYVRAWTASRVADRDPTCEELLLPQIEEEKTGDYYYCYTKDWFHDSTVYE